MGLHRHHCLSTQLVSLKAVSSPFQSLGIHIKTEDLKSWRKLKLIQSTSLVPSPQTCCWNLLLQGSLHYLWLVLSKTVGWGKVSRRQNFRVSFPGRYATLDQQRCWRYFLEQAIVWRWLAWLAEGMTLILARVSVPWIPASTEGKQEGYGIFWKLMGPYLQPALPFLLPWSFISDHSWYKTSSCRHSATPPPM